MGFGVHKQDQALLQQLNHSIRRLQPKINRVLAAFAIPIVDTAKEAQ
jgi:hypothetical protein